MTTAFPEAVQSLRSARTFPSVRFVWASVVNGVDRWLQRRRAMRQLYMLDHRTMKDLGMHRTEVNSIIFGGAADRRRSYADN